KDGKRRLFLSAYFLFCRDHCGFRQFFGICQRVQFLTQPYLQGHEENDGVEKINFPIRPQGPGQ
ncbi:hypothetical protein JXX18_13655, partial [Ruthenibacterium lactatiformans]|uniref:hypothetical protein n=1 Tax=Ruthenibacterium lactatiformans TaxID=1550024 RepID=UPI0019684E63